MTPRFFFFHLSFAERALLILTVLLSAQACVYNTLPQPVDCADDPVALHLAAAEDTDCGANEGSIEVSATGGTGAYRFRIGSGEPQQSSFFAGLSAGIYLVMATDDNNCSDTLAVTIRNREGLNLSIETTEAGCYEHDGTITVAAEDGVPPYEFRIDDGAFQDANSFSGLAHGEYTVTVRDATGCEVSQQLRVRSGISFAAAIAPIIESTCAVTGCHNGTQFPDFRSFKNIQDNAQLIKAQVVTRAMPIDDTLTQDEINSIICWVDDGALNN